MPYPIGVLGLMEESG